jgi:hypothetical protein
MAEPTTIRELLVYLGVVAETDEIEAFDKRLDKARATMHDAREHATKLRDGIADLLGWLARGALAVTGFVGGLVWQAQATSESALQIERQAAALGLSVERYQELQGALQAYNVDQRDFADLMAQITQQAQAAGDGSENIAAAWEALGVSVDEVAKAQPEEILMLLADGMRATTDDAKRLSASSTLLGEDLAKKTGALLMTGRDGLNAYGEELRALGAIMSEDDVAAAKTFQLTLGKLDNVVKGVRNEIGMRMIPVLDAVAGRFLSWVMANRDLISARLEYYLARVEAGFYAVADSVAAADRWVTERLGSWERVAIGVAGAIAMIVGGVGAFKVGGIAYNAIAAIYYLGSALAILLGTTLLPALLLIASGVVGLGVALIPPIAYLTALYLLIDDLYTYLSGGQSTIGTFLETWRGTGGVLGGVVEVLDALGRVFAALYAAGVPIASLLGGILLSAAAGLRDVLADLWSVLSPVLGALGSAVLADTVETLNLIAGGLERVAILAERFASGMQTATSAGGLLASLTGFLGPGEGAALAGGSGGRSFAPAPGALPGAGGGRTMVDARTQTESRTYTINGATDPIAVRQAVETYDAEKRRFTSAAFEGGDR